MLAHFSLLGGFSSLLAGSSALLAFFKLMLVVFFELMVATGSILGSLGRVLEPSQPHLSMIFAVSKHASQTCSSCNKTTVFAMFYKLRNMPHMSTKHVFSIAFKAFLDMAHGLLQKPLAGIHFLLFKPTLQRGGTCEAHGIEAKLAQNATNQNLNPPLE